MKRNIWVESIVVLSFLLLPIIIFSSCSVEDTIQDKPYNPYNDDLDYKLTGVNSGIIRTEFETYTFTEGEERAIYVYGKRNLEEWDYIWYDVSEGTKIWNRSLCWYTENLKEFTVPVLIQAQGFVGTQIITIKAGLYLGESNYTFPCTLNVVADRDYNVHYSYIKTSQNYTYHILEDIATQPPFPPMSRLESIYSDFGIDLNISFDPIRNHNTPYVVIPQGSSLLTWWTALEDYYSLIGGKRGNTSSNYIEIVGMDGIRDMSNNTYAILGISAPVSMQVDAGAVGFIFQSSINALSYDPLRLKKLKVLATAHELGHCRDYKTGLTPPVIWLTDHESGHNGLNNKPCIMSVPNRFNTAPWNNQDYFFEQASNALSFCEGHKQRLLNIDWSY